MDLGLAGRQLAVTAASRGLGRAIATALVGEGAEVVLVARESTDLRDAAEELGGSTRAIAADLTSAEAPDLILSSLAGRPLDGLVVNVGGPEPGTALTYTDAQWRAAIDTVLMSSIRLVRAAEGHLADGASVLFVLSSTVKEPIDTLGASNVLRPGLGMLVKDLSVQWAARQIRVNGLLPGRIATQRMVALTGGTPEGLAAVESEIPMGRLGTPEEFGRVGTFLLSPAASYVTGQLLAVDGGLLRSPW